MASLTVFETRNLTSFFAVDLVAGLLTTLDFLWTRTRRPTPGNTNSPVSSDRSARKDRSLATFLEMPSFLAAFAADGNPVAIFTGPRNMLSRA